MSALVVTLLRFGFLALIWIFVGFVLVTIRNDVFGTRIRERAGMRPSSRKSASSRQTAPGGPTTPGTPTPPAPAHNAPAGPTHLVVTKGPLSGTVLPLGKATITIGRSPDSALVLDDGYASSRHARFFSEGGQWYIEDLNSTNGTWVGNQRIYGATPLRMGVPIIIGKTTMELRR
ncbi:MAG: FHA domain-containing protein [Actinomycetaceae bacterium]|nr:FHA domain-containing protein [Actinomycetaceae bacterium]